MCFHGPWVAVGLSDFFFFWSCKSLISLQKPQQTLHSVWKRSLIFYPSVSEAIWTVFLAQMFAKVTSRAETSRRAFLLAQEMQVGQMQINFSKQY